MTPASNKVALVTGGGTGVGKATSLQLAARGYDVVVNYSRSKEDAEVTAAAASSRGAQAIAMHCDVADDAAVRHMVAACGERFGRLDLVVNNAGMTYFVDFADLEGMSEEKWDRLLDVNLKGAFFVSRAAAELLGQSDNGAIVNVASVAGVAGAGSSIAYAATKGGMITLTKSLARTMAPAVRVNAVCPGVIISRWLADHPDMVDAAIAVTPLARACTTQDVADVVTFLACDARMMTGQALIVDGGRTM